MSSINCTNSEDGNADGNRHHWPVHVLRSASTKWTLLVMSIAAIGLVRLFQMRRSNREQRKDYYGSVEFSGQNNFHPLGCRYSRHRSDNPTMRFSLYDPAMQQIHYGPVGPRPGDSTMFRVGKSRSCGATPLGNLNREGRGLLVVAEVVRPGLTTCNDLLVWGFR